MRIILFTFDAEKNTSVQLLQAAQTGDDRSRETIIASHQNFVRQMVAKSIGVYEDIDARDEYAVGLIALNEAIDSYKPGLLSFRSFAARVIKRRVIDYIRSQKKHRNQVVYMDETVQRTIPETNLDPTEDIHARLEMECYIDRLARFGINMADLIKETPKHADSKQLCMKIAWLVCNDQELKDHFIKYNTLPNKKILNRISLNTKTLERHRKYIIAICLILLSDLEEMRAYITDLYKGGERNDR